MAEMIRHDIDGGGMKTEVEMLKTNRKTEVGILKKEAEAKEFEGTRHDKFNLKLIDLSQTASYGTNHHYPRYHQYQIKSARNCFLPFLVQHDPLRTLPRELSNEIIAKILRRSFNTALL